MMVRYNLGVDYNLWDFVQFEFKGNSIKGTVLPSNNLGVIVLKLDSGYNAGFDVDHIINLKILGKISDTIASETDLFSESESNNSDLMRVSLVHTGGTIASKVDYATGGVVSKFSPKDILAMYPELSSIANINSVVLGNISSENMTLFQINALAKLVKSEIDKGAKGVVITHGTDTLHYTSAALHYMLSGLKVPVVLVGSQRSSDRPSSDARMNLVCAFRFINKYSDLGGVFISMHAGEDDDICHILYGLNARKSHSSIRGAFKSVNLGPLFSVNYVTGDIVDLRSSKEFDFIKSNVIFSDSFKLLTLDDSLKVGIVNAYPGFDSNLLNFYLDSDYSGLILNGTGLGHFPIVDDSLIGQSDTGVNRVEFNKRTYDLLVKLSKKIPVVMSTQTGGGIVNLNVYSPGRLLKSMGVLGDQSYLTFESNYMKLLFLLSNYSVDDLKKFY